MESEYSFIEVSGPDIQERTIDLQEEKQRLTIGRKDDNDIVLIPDPQKNVSRKHCFLEQGEDGYWWVKDNASANGTFLRQNGTKIDVQQKERVRLKDGDVILILAKLPLEGEPIFWELTFRERGLDEPTNKAVVSEILKAPMLQLLADYLEYNFNQKTLFCINEQNRKEISLAIHERKMIHYMVLQNKTKNGVAVLCNYEALISAIWDNPFGHNKYDVNHLVYRLRQKIEQDSGNPRFLKTIPGEGYLLEIQLIE